MINRGGTSGRSRLNTNPSFAANGSAKGGMNTKGTGWGGKPGKFQYGWNQYGFINKAGDINWKAKAPGKRQNVVGWGNVQNWANKQGKDIPSQNRRPAFYHDSTYNRMMGDLIYQRGTNVADLQEQLRKMKGDFADQGEALKRDQTKNIFSMGGNAAARGIVNSGMYDKNMEEIDFQFGQRTKDLNRNLGGYAQKQLVNQRNREDDRYDILRKAYSDEAKRRWKLEHEGEKPPKYRVGVHQQGKGYYHTDKSGKRVSLDRKDKKVGEFRINKLISAFKNTKDQKRRNQLKTRIRNLGGLYGINPRKM